MNSSPLLARPLYAKDDLVHNEFVHPCADLVAVPVALRGAASVDEVPEVKAFEVRPTEMTAMILR